MRLIGIDYGIKRIGIAITDPMQIISYPLETIETRNIISFLSDYLQKEKCEKIIIGWPLNLKGQENAMTKKVSDFITKIASHINIPIIKYDERFTSSLALHSLVESNTTKKYRKDKSNIDKVSASLILRSYLSRAEKS